MKKTLHQTLVFEASDNLRESNIRTELALKMTRMCLK